jgi:Pertussis toxin, subunit 1
MIPQNDPFSQKEPPGREKRRNVAWKGYILVFVALVMTLASSSFFIIKTHAAGGSGETSNLSNRYLGAQNDVFPGRLYRGDSRSPDDIFANGFTAKGKDYDLERHVQGNQDTGYISTTGTLSEAEDYAELYGQENLAQLPKTHSCTAGTDLFYALIPMFGQFLLASCEKELNQPPFVTQRTYVYEIDPAYALNAYYVPTAIRSNANLYAEYHAQDEWAYIHEIPTEAIVGVHVYQMQAHVHADGSLDPTFVSLQNLNQFVPNPNYGGTTGSHIIYNPGNDTSSGWTFDTDLDLPTTSCPADPHVYQHCG